MLFSASVCSHASIPIGAMKWLVFKDQETRGEGRSEFLDQTRELNESRQYKLGSLKPLTLPLVFISQKLKKLQEAENLPFCPTNAALFL